MKLEERLMKLSQENNGESKFNKRAGSLKISIKQINLQLS